MFAATPDFATFNRSSSQALLQFAQVSLDAAERSINLNLNAGREAMVDLTRSAQVFKQPGDLEQFAAWPTNFAQFSAEKFASYSKSVYESAQRTQREFSNVFETTVAELNDSVTAGLDSMLKSAPAGSDTLVAAIRSSVAATTAAVENFVKAAKQVASVTEANVEAATHSMAASVKPTKRK